MLAMTTPLVLAKRYSMALGQVPLVRMVLCRILVPGEFQVRIGADGVSAQRLHELVEWSEAHSIVSCAVRAVSKIDLEVELA